MPFIRTKEKSSWDPMAVLRKAIIKVNPDIDFKVDVTGEGTRGNQLDLYQEVSSKFYGEGFPE